MLSFWEHKEFIQHDYIVVGSGITGLSTACVIKERKPAAKVLVLERGLFPTGASTKNAGFACIGSLGEKVYDLGLMGEEKLLSLIEDRWKGLHLLRKRLGDERIGYENNGGYELILKEEAVNHLEHLAQMNALLRSIFKEDVFKEDKGRINAFGFNPGMLRTVVCNRLEGQLDTGKMMDALYRYATALGIKVITGAGVDAIEVHNDLVEVTVSSADKTNLTFKAKKAAVCTNAFTKKLFPQLEITPGRGQVICTGRLTDLKFKGTFNFDAGFYYFRNFDDRIILGGGRNLDFEKETSTEFVLNEKIISKLEYYLKELIIPGQAFEIEYKWTGIMAFGSDKLPLLTKINDHVAVGARLNGMGIALGSKIAEDLANLIV